MSFSKKMLAFAAVTALTAATAVPAMALENEFHGLYRVRAIHTNFQNAAPAGALSADSSSLNAIEQRIRLLYAAKANDDLKLVTHFEVDSTWGDAAYFVGRGAGAAIGADSVNIETKNIYLDFKIPATPVKAQVGVQPFTDAYKGIFITDDVAGLALSGKAGAATISGAFFRLNDAGGAAAIGKANVDLITLDGKFAVSKDLSVGGSYYLVRNDLNVSGQDLHMFGVNAAANLGPVAVDGFAIYQTGDEIYAVAARDVSAYAAQVAAKAKVGPGSLRGAVLYASGENGSGDSSAFQNIRSGATTANFTSSASAYYAGDMLLMMRSKWAMDSDRAIVSATNNSDMGLMFIAAGYDVPISSKVSATANVGYMRAADTATGSKSIGTEVNAQVNYKMYDNLTGSLQGAYVFLGDRLDANDDPYLATAMLNYTF